MIFILKSCITERATYKPKQCTYGTTGGVARPGPTRACALSSTFQALPSPAQQESRDSMMNYTRKQMYYSLSSVSTSVCMQQIINLLINTLRLTKYIRPLSAYEIY